MGNINRFSVDFTDLGDGPGSINALEFLRGNAGGTALEWYDLFGSNNTWTGTNTHQADVITDGANLRPNTNQNDEVGTATNRFNTMRARFLMGVGDSTSGGGIDATPTATRTYGANPTGIAAGNNVETGGGGVATFRHGQGGGANNPFKPVATIANVFANYGDSNVLNNGGGSFLGGSCYTYGAGTADLISSNFGNFTWAYTYVSGAGNHNFTNAGPGAFLGGYSQGTGTVSVDNSNQCAGGFTWVRPTANAGNTADVNNQGAGGFVQGRIQANGGGVSQLGIFNNAGDGAFAQGYVNNFGATAGNLRANGAGAFAQGRANGADILAGGAGSFAHGFAQNGSTISSGGQGAFAAGSATAGATISATATNSFQWAPGTNSLATSLAVGDMTGTGLRLAGGGAPGVPVNGDFWHAGTDVYVESNGNTFRFVQSAAWTVGSYGVRRSFAGLTPNFTEVLELLETLVEDLQVPGWIG